MANRNEILNRIGEYKNAGQDLIRREYLSNLHEYRDRRKFCVIDEPRQYENLRLSQE